MGIFTKSKSGDPEIKPTPQQTKQSIDAAIDRFMVDVCGYRNPAERINEHGQRHFKKGSADGLAWTTVDGEGAVYFHCAAYVMDLPSDRALLLPFYRELMEHNWSVTGGQRFAVLKNGLWVTYSEDSSILSASLVAWAIHRTMTLADAADNKLIEKYGGVAERNT